jgi:hypothetical protein
MPGSLLLAFVDATSLKLAKLNEPFLIMFIISFGIAGSILAFGSSKGVCCLNILVPSMIAFT